MDKGFSINIFGNKSFDLTSTHSLELKINGKIFKIEKNTSLTLIKKGDEISTKTSDFAVENGSIVAYKGNQKDLLIPSEINGQKIRSIGRMALAKKNLESIELAPGIESIDTGAFLGNPNLKTIKLNQDLKTIGDNAFTKASIENLVLPENLQSIGKNAFKSNSIKELVFKENLREIGNNAFDSNKINKLQLPENLKIIGDGAFKNNKIQKLILPDAISYVGPAAFQGNPLESLALAKNLENLSFKAFDYENLRLELKEEIQLSDREKLEDLVHIRLHCHSNKGEEEEFVGLKWTKKGENYIGRFNSFKTQLDGNKAVSNIKIQAKVIEAEKTTVEESGFVVDSKTESLIGYKGSDKNIVIPEEIKGIKIKKINTKDFSRKGLESLVLPEGLKKIEGQMVFAGNKLKSLDLPDSLESIGKGAFVGNKNLTKLKLGKNLDLIDNNAFTNCSLEELVLPAKLRKIGANAFMSNNLEKLTFEDGRLSTIGNAAFKKNNIKSLKLPKSLRLVDNAAFQNNSIEELIIPEGNLIKIGSQSFADNKLKSVNLNKNLKYILFHSFRNNPGQDGKFKISFKDLEIDASNLTELEDKLSKEIVLNAYCQSVASENPESTAIVWTQEARDGEYIVFKGRFKDFTQQTGGNTDLEKLILEIRVKSSVKPDNSAWELDDFILEGKTLKGLSEKGEKKIFFNKNLELPEGVEKVGSSAFSKLAIESLKISNSIEEIGFNAFMGNKLKSLEIPSNVKILGKNSFAAAGIEELVLNDGLEEIGEYAFSGNKIYSLELPSSLRILKEKSFYQSEIHEVKFNQGLELIGNQSFENNKIKKLELPSSLKAVDVGAFVYNDLNQLELPHGLKILGPKSFGVNNIESVRIPETLEWICPNAFRKNKGFEGEEFKLILDQDINLTQDLNESQMFEYLNKQVKLRPAVFKGLISEEKFPIDIIDWEIIGNKDGILSYRGKFDRVPEDKIDCGFGTSCEDVVSNMKKTSLIVEVKTNGHKITKDEFDKTKLIELIAKAKSFKEDDYTETSFKELQYAMELPDRYEIQAKNKVQKLSQAIENLESVGKEDDGLWTTEDFTYEGDTLLGFSEEGQEKLKDHRFISFPELTPSGQKLRRIGRAAFSKEFNDDKISILGIKLPESVEEIGATAFRNHGIKDLDLSQVKVLGSGTFASNRDLETLTLSKDLKEIPNGCFSFSNLKELTIPEGVELIGGSAFNESNKLEKIVFPSSLKEIGKRAFTNINAFEISIPSNVKKIGMEAFSGGKISKLKLEEGLETIEKRAFKRNKIENIIIPSTVVNLAQDAFDAMPSVNIEYRKLLDLKQDLQGLEGAENLIEKIDELNKGKEGRLDQVLELITEIEEFLKLQKAA